MLADGTIKRVLVIDDSRIARQQVINALKGAHFEVVEAVDGSDGIQKLDADPALCLVICDVNMPRMSGIEVLATLRGRTKAPPPFLMLTSEAQPELIAEAKRQGAAAWMLKPFKPEHLIAAATKLAV